MAACITIVQYMCVLRLTWYPRKRAICVRTFLVVVGVARRSSSHKTVITAASL